jgi:hypothetical protein
MPDLEWIWNLGRRCSKPIFGEYSSDFWQIIINFFGTGGITSVPGINPHLVPVMILRCEKMAKNGWIWDFGTKKR